MPEIEGREKRLLLISNSTLYGSGYLVHAEKEIRDFLGAVRRVLFIPFAQHGSWSICCSSAQPSGISTTRLIKG